MSPSQRGPTITYIVRISQPTGYRTEFQMDPARDRVVCASYDTTGAPMWAPVVLTMGQFERAVTEQLTAASAREDT